MLPPFPAIVVLTSDTGTMQLFLVVEKRLLVSSFPDFRTAILALIAAYFAFDMAYPKPLYSTLLFIQHYMLNIRDDQTVPNAITIAYSAMIQL